jgi:hypothetical protein
MCGQIKEANMQLGGGNVVAQMHPEVIGVQSFDRGWSAETDQSLPITALLGALHNEGEIFDRLPPSIGGCQDEVDPSRIKGSSFLGIRVFIESTDEPA